MTRRLVLTLEAGAFDPDRLEHFVRLAAELGIDLEALLIEDQDLHTVAGLPFCQEVIRHTARSRRLSPDRLEQASRQLSQELQRHLRQLTQRSSVHWRLRTYRGHWLEGLGDNWAQTELLVLARARPRSFSPPPRVAESTVAVVCGGKAASSRRALQLAARLASSQRQPLLVLALPDCPYQSTRELANLLPRQGQLRLEPLTTDTPSELRAWLPATTDTLILPRDWIWPGGQPAPHPLLELPGIQTLVVR